MARCVSEVRRAKWEVRSQAPSPVDRGIADCCGARLLPVAQSKQPIAAGFEKELDAIKIEGIPCSVAIQPVAVGKGSDFKQLTGRLLAALRSAESWRLFEANGFGRPPAPR